MNTTLLFMGIGTQELLFIALIVLLLFGGKKIPELMKGLGKGVKSFKDGMNGVEENLKDSAEKTDKSRHFMQNQRSVLLSMLALPRASERMHADYSLIASDYSIFGEKCQYAGRKRLRKRFLW